jgi:4-amino-4-deoxy-L-arabinose transferase-like glycosyltransferase
LGGRPLWYDEAFTVLYAEKPLETMLHGTVTRLEGAAAEEHPLFSYLTLHYWMLAFGQSPVAVRALSVFLGTATVVMAYLLGRRLSDRRVGLAAALVVAVAPFHIYYSQEARMYALLGFAALTMTYFFVRAWTDGGWGNWFAFGVLGALTLYAHNLGILFLAALDLWVLWAWFRPGGVRWRNFRPLLLSHLLIIGLFAPWLIVVPTIPPPLATAPSPLLRPAHTGHYRFRTHPPTPGFPFRATARYSRLLTPYFPLRVPTPVPSNHPHPAHLPRLPDPADLCRACAAALGANILCAYR